MSALPESSWHREPPSFQSDTRETWKISSEVTLQMFSKDIEGIKLA
jgi:hypothetical protein